MHRRIFVLAVASLVALLGFAPTSVAQDATPGSGGAFDELGLPTLDVTVTADGYEGIPDSLEAGRYLVTVIASEDAGEFGGGVGFVQPVGVTGQEFIDLIGQMGGPPEEEAVDEASPVAEGGEMDMGPPDFFFDFGFAGGAYAAPGTSTQVVLDLTPGEWVAWGDDPEAPWAPVVFEATGEMPADLIEPESGATITMGEYVIQVTEGELVAGTQVIRVDNIGAQPHFISAGTTSVEITEADVEAVLQSDMTGTPAAVDFNPDEDFQEAFFTGTQSMGTSLWVEVTLEPGTLLMLCFFPDLADGLPHAYHGMYSIVEVREP